MTKEKLSIIFSIILFIVFAIMAWSALGFPKLAMYFPLTLAIVGMVATLINIMVEYRNYRNNQTIEPEETNSEEIEWDMPVTHSFKAASINFLWFLSYFVLIMIFGFLVATIIFLVLFLKKKTDLNWVKINVATALSIVLLIILGKGIDLKFPPGFIDLFGISNFL